MSCGPIKPETPEQGSTSAPRTCKRRSSCRSDSRSSQQTCSTCTSKRSDHGHMQELSQHRSEFNTVAATIQKHIKHELRWLQNTVDRTPERVREKLVAHRGFHHADESTLRPLENSIHAFTHAWASGFTYCAGGISLLSDGNMVLNSDNCLTRLAGERNFNSREDLSTMNTGDVLRTRLKNGLTAPLLTNVINHAKALKGKLIVELKRGCKSPAVLVKLFANDADSRECVGLVTSKDRTTLEEFVREHEEQLPLVERPTTLLKTKTVSAGSSVGVTDPNTVVSPLSSEKVRAVCGKAVDGVYLEYTDETMQCKEKFSQLCSDMVVGVWTRGDTHDNAVVAEELISCGAQYVNTNLPYTFLSPIVQGCPS